MRKLKDLSTNKVYELISYSDQRTRHGIVESEIIYRDERGIVYTASFNRVFGESKPTLPHNFVITLPDGKDLLI